MFSSKRIPLFAFLTMVLPLLAACSPGTAATVPSPTADSYRATPESDSPAAGICVAYDQATIRVEISIWPDNVPQPRCIKVRAGQTLVLINRAPEPIEFTLGRFHASIEPGRSYAVDLPFGQYLAPGAHSLHVTPYGGPEIYFE